MKERKDLIATSPSGNPDYQYYLKEEADAVMDKMEREHELQDFTIKCLQERIKELEANKEESMLFLDSYWKKLGEYNEKKETK